VAALAVLIGFSGLVGWSSAQPPHHQTIKSTANTTQNKTIQDVAAEVIAYYTKVLAWFTALLVFVSAYQGYMLLRSTRIAERALLDLDRACLIPGFPVPVKGFHVWNVLIAVSNVGRSYGILKGIHIRFAESAGTLPVRPPIDGYEMRETDTVLSPGDKPFTGILPFRLPSAREGQVIYGYLRYEDAFGRMWRNRFAIAVHSDEEPGRHFYQTIGGAVYNAETLEK
jgi:hypothetical protein